MYSSLSSTGLKSQLPFWIRFSLLFLFIFAAVHPRSLWAQPERLVVIDKASRILILYTPALSPMVFPVSLGVDPVSDKRRIGDCATPEGLYQVSHKKMSKRFHQFIGLSYPNPTDACEALIHDVITRDECSRIRSACIRSLPSPCDTQLGNHIGIHGGGVVNQSGGTAATDWTEGCIAMENDHIGSVFSTVDPGDPILIFHSKKDLYGMLLPLTAPRDADPSAGVCPEGIYLGEAWIETSIGIIQAELIDSRDFTRSLTCRLYTDAKDPPALVIEDLDGDGKWGPLDRFSGGLKGETDPSTIMERIRREVTDALRRGAIAPLSDTALAFSQQHSSTTSLNHGPGCMAETR